MTKNIAVGRAIGKIILIGEHSVVYGQPAIAIPFLSARIKTTIHKSDTKVTLNSLSYNGDINDAPEDLLGLTTVIKKALNELNKPLEGFNIEIESSIPSERGMGSSAAVSAATIRALYKYFKADLDDKTLTRLVNFSEEIVHGNASGIDTAIVVAEKPLYYIKGKPLEQFDYSLDGYLIVSDTGEKGKTKFAVSKVKAFIEEDLDKGNSIISMLGDLTIKARKSITDNKAIQLGIIMNQAQSLLKELGVSNNTIENLVKVSLDNGALGSKLTGGGLGGSVITLCANKEDAKRISNTLLNNGAKNTWIMNMRYNEGDLNES